MRTPVIGLVALLLALPVASLAALPEGAALAHRDGVVSVDWKDANLSDALRLLAKVGGVNLVLDPAVQGKTLTLALADVPWQQALDLVVATHGMGTELEGNVLRVAPMAKMTAEAQQRGQLADARRASAPLSTLAFPLSWTDAAQAEAIARKGLSPRGSTFVDKRTNTLFITDDFGTAPLPTGFAPGLDLVAARADAPHEHEVLVRVLGDVGAGVAGVRATVPPAREASPAASARLGLTVGRRVDVPGAPGVQMGLERDGSRVVLVVRAGRSGAQVPAEGRQAVALVSAAGGEALLVAEPVVY